VVTDIRHVLPGQSGGDTSWFERQNTFEQAVILHQVGFKRARWPDIEGGRFSKQPRHIYPHILPKGSERLAFCDSIADDVLNYLSQERIALHSEALNLKSSQVACLNVLFPFRQDLHLATRVFKGLFPGLATVTGIEFEYTGPTGTTEWLGEPPDGMRGQNRTSIDAAIFWKDADGKGRASLVEWKYTERSFGGCSAYAKAGPEKRRSCDRLNLLASDLGQNCLLTSGEPRRSRLYWKRMEQSGISLGKLSRVAGCPFKGPLYQLMRQTLVARHTVDCGEADRAEVVSVSFAGNRELHTVPRELLPLADGQTSDILTVWNSMLLGMPPLRNITVEQLMSQYDGTPNQDGDWRTYIRDRYGI